MLSVSLNKTFPSFRDSEVLTHQLSLSLEETEPLKKAKADLESVVIQKNTNIQTLQDQLQASEVLLGLLAFITLKYKYKSGFKIIK